MNYLYDGTFDGFLTCVYEHYHSGKADAIAAENSGFQGNFFTDVCSVETDPVKADIVAGAIRDKISPYDLKRVYTVFRSCAEKREIKLLRYIILGFKRGAQIRLMHTHPDVMPVEQAENKLAFEVHRLCGLVRFSDIQGGILYSKIDPDNDVLEFLAPHFTARFHSDPFIIHDERRHKALFAYNRRWHIADFTEADAAGIRLSESEEEYRALWRRYFETISIKERTNPRCQRTLMPGRYWKNLTEVNNVGIRNKNNT